MRFTPRSSGSRGVVDVVGIDERVAHPAAELDERDQAGVNEGGKVVDQLLFESRGRSPTREVSAVARSQASVRARVDPVDSVELGRRIRAARGYAGLSARALAEQVSDHGISARTLRHLEQGEHLASTEQLEVISNACGVPTAWFEFDWHAAGNAETALAVIATRLRDLEEGLRVIEAAVSPGRRKTKPK